jgi:hypothetical protein
VDKVSLGFVEEYGDGTLTASEAANILLHRCSGYVPSSHRLSG